MNVRRLWWSAALLLLAPALAGLAADKDGYGDPLPAGAKARFGTARLRILTSPQPVLAPDGKTLFVQSSSGLFRLDPATGAALGKAPLPFYGTAFVLSANGKRVASASANGAVVCEIDSGKPLAKIERRLPPADAVALSGDGTVLALGGAGDGIKKDPVTVLVWDVAGDKERTKLSVPHNEYAYVSVSNTGKTLATWGQHRDAEGKGTDAATNPARFVTFWDATTGKEQAKFRVAGFAPARVVLSPDGALAAVAGTDGAIELVDTKTGAPKHLLLGRSRMGHALSFSPDGTTLIACAEDGAAQRWKVADGTRLSTTEPPVGQLLATGVRAPSTEKGVAWGMRGSAAMVWEVPSGKLISTEGGHTALVRGIAVTPDGKHVLTSSEDGTTMKWELATGKPVGAVAIRTPNFGFGGSAPPASLSRDATRALVRDASGVGVHDLATGSQQYVIPTPFEGWSYAAFSPDGARVVVTSSSYEPKKTGRVTVWDAAAGKRLGAIEVPGSGPLAAALTPDGKLVVTAVQKPAEKGNGEFVVTAWETGTGTKRGEFVEEGGVFAPHVATASDNTTAAVVTPKGRLVAFDLLTGKIGKTYEIKRRPSIAPVFSPDGKKLVIAGAVEYNPTPGAPILVLDWPSGEVKYAFTAPGGVPGVMVFAPDGKSLVTSSPDTTALVWDVSK